MAKRISKRMQQANKLATTEIVSIEQAIENLKAMPLPKFTPSVEVIIKLNIDATKSDQNVRGAATMPHGLGKKIKVAVFAQGSHPYADHVISDEDAARAFINDPIDIDAVVAAPDIMVNLMKWGVSKVLGPKGLMPNAKLGTVTNDIEQAVTNLRKGQAKFKNDKAGYLQASVGPLTFDTNALVENIQSFVAAVVQAKPAAVKINFVQSVRVGATLCPSFKVAFNQ